MQFHDSPIKQANEVSVTALYERISAVRLLTVGLVELLSNFICDDALFSVLLEDP